MILRDTVVSEQRRVVGVPPSRSARTQADEVAASVEPSVAATTVAAALAVSPPAPAPREPRLTFESVAAWLAVQDGETRTACASVLSDELTQVHESARAEGRANGEREARADAEQALATERTALRALSEAAERAFAEEQQRVGELCAEIVAEAFAKIAGRLLPTRDAARGAVLEVLERVKEGRELSIRVNPQDIAALERDEELLAAAIPGRTYSLHGDARIELGGCIVESRLGSLDGRLEVQLNALYETLRAARAASKETS